MAWYFYEAVPESKVPPGTKARCHVEGFDIAIYNVDGTFYASADACPHERVSLGDGGFLDGEKVTCGAHRWCFNIRTGECYEDPGFQLQTFPVGRKEGVVYVGFWGDDTVEEEAPTVGLDDDEHAAG